MTINEIRKEDLYSIIVGFRSHIASLSNGYYRITIPDEEVETFIYEYLKNKYLACRFDDLNVTTLVHKKKIIKEKK